MTSRAPLIALVAAVLLAACSKPPERKPEGGPTPEPPLALEILYDGCREVLRGETCVLNEDRRLRLWVRGPAKTTLAFDDGHGAVFKPGPLVDGGQRFTGQVGAEAVQLTVTAQEGRRRAQWTLSLDHRQETALVVQAKALRAAGRLEEARVLLEGAVEPLAPEEQSYALGVLARVYLHSGKPRQALETIERAMSLHRRLGHVLQEANDLGMLAFVCLYILEDIASVRRFLREPVPLIRSGEAIAAHYRARAQLAFEDGVLHEALGRVTAESATANRLGLDSRVLSMLLLADVLLAMGRLEDAARAQRQARDALAPSAATRDRATVLIHLSWTQLMLRESESLDHVAEAMQIMETVAALLDEKGERDRVETDLIRANNIVNLALGAYFQDDVARAAQYLRQADAANARKYPVIAVWMLDIEGRLLRRAGKPQASLAKYREMAAFAQARGMTASVYWALAGQAAAFAGAGQREAAADKYGEADALLDGTVLRLGLADGRAAFMAQRGRVFREHLALLLELGRLEDALTLARRANARLFLGAMGSRALRDANPEAQARWDAAVAAYRKHRQALSDEAGQEWRLPKAEAVSRREARSQEEQRLVRELEAAQVALRGRSGVDFVLSKIAADETLLIVTQDARGWVALAKDQAGVEVARQPAAVGSALSAKDGDALLAPLLDKLRGARQVRVLGAEAYPDFAPSAMNVEGAPLMAQVPVVYSLDVATLTPSPAHEAKAVVVLDPEGNLSLARTEAEHLRRALGGSKGSRVALLERDRATLSSVTEALGQATLFHFSGHATSDEARGFGSALRLAGGTLFGPSDVLSLPRVPRQVLLLGCGTGQARTSSGAVLGVAQAFVLGGSELVVATVRDLPDASAAKFSRLFYADATRTSHPVEAARRALLALRTGDPNWTALRLYSR